MAHKYGSTSVTSSAQLVLTFCMGNSESGHLSMGDTAAKAQRIKSNCPVKGQKPAWRAKAGDRGPTSTKFYVQNFIELSTFVLFSRIFFSQFDLIHAIQMHFSWG